MDTFCGYRAVLALGRPDLTETTAFSVDARIGIISYLDFSIGAGQLLEGAIALIELS